MTTAVTLSIVPLAIARASNASAKMQASDSPNGAALPPVAKAAALLVSIHSYRNKGQGFQHLLTASEVGRMMSGFCVRCACLRGQHVLKCSQHLWGTLIADLVEGLVKSFQSGGGELDELAGKWG